MSFKPSDFFINVIDFFSVILPGALVTYFLQGLFFDSVFGQGKIFPPLDTAAEKWIGFLIATYIIGNLIFLLASFLLDKLVYDRVLRKTFQKNDDLIYKTATLIREQYVPTEDWIVRLGQAGFIGEKDEQQFLERKHHYILNTFKWCQYYLGFKYPEATIEVRKLEADSKFFRSMVVAFLILAIVILIQAFLTDQRIYWISSALCFVLSLPCLYRYGDLRYKSTERAYSLMITAENLQKPEERKSLVQPDNRSLFLASVLVKELYADKIKSLTIGMNKNMELLSVPQGRTWKKNASNQETVLCLSGKAIGKIGLNGNSRKVVVIPNAIIPLSENSSSEFSNDQAEPLVLLSVK